MKEALGDYEVFVERSLDVVRSNNIDLGDLSWADMLCYRVESNLEYEEMKARLFARAAIQLAESEVSGRLITVFELNPPLQAGGWTVKYLELPQPKPQNKYVSGLEHLQFVTTADVETFRKKYPDVHFNEGGALHNVLLELKSDDTTVKFHDKSIADVLRLENESL